jgi:serine/threonine protein kinase
MFVTQATGKPLKSMNPKVALDHWGAWFSQALEALAWLHANGQTHGFLDPASLRIDESLALKLYVRPHTLNLTTFDPKHTIYPPEILLKQAHEVGLSFTSAYDLLESKNPSLELCETQLDLDYSARTLQFVWKHLEVLDPYKADVWMLGITFLRHYLEFLAWPGALTTSFYRHDNDRFLDCLTRMLEAHPIKRFSAELAFQTWSPPLLLYPEVEEPDADAMLPPDNEVSAVAESSVPSNSGPVEAESASENLLLCPCPERVPERVPPKPRRLVLNAHHDPAAHNKTRRNPRNLNPIPATGNPVKHTQD